MVPDDRPAPRPVEPATIDAVVCVGPGPVGIALAAIEGLRGFTGVARIEVIAVPDAVAPLRRVLGAMDRVAVRDEREVDIGLDRTEIERFLASRGADPRRAGWYLQQFLKLAAAAEPGPSWRLLWDGDTLPLRPLRLLSDESPPRPLLAPRGGHHPPYLRTIERLLGAGSLAPHSFVHEHLLLRHDLVVALLDAIRARAASGVPWPAHVLDSIDPRDLRRSNVSEFETYGTFVHRRDRSHFAVRPLRSTRDAMIVLGPTPATAGLQGLSRRFDLATFEARHRTSRRGRWRARLGIRGLGRLIDSILARGAEPSHVAVLDRMARRMQE